jgi:hypothetical protein
MAKVGSRFLPPEGVLDARLVDWGSGRTMYRVHDAAYAANLFNSSPTGNARFSPIRDEGYFAPIRTFSSISINIPQ